MPPIVDAPPPPPAEPRFDVAVRNASAQAFFTSLVEDTDESIIVHPSVSADITLSLKNATLTDVMRAVRSVYGLSIRRTAAGWEVLPPRLEARVFAIDYPNLMRHGMSTTRVSTGQTSGREEETPTDTGVMSSGRSSHSTSGTQIETSSDTELWREIEATAWTLIGRSEGRSVVLSPQAGTLVVRAMPEELESVAGYVDQIRDTLGRQVILEARILEVRLSDGFQAGVNWAKLFENGDDEALVGQIGGGSALDSGASEIRDNSGSLDPRIGDIFDSATTSAFGGVFTLAISASKFAALIELLETQGDVRILSSPRIATINNQKAVIKVGSDEFFVTDFSTTTVTGTSPVTTPDVELTPFFSGIALDVTPQIAAAGEVILHVHPSVSDVTDQTKEIRFNGERQTLPLAFSRIRESDSIVRARSGQVVVIGGLMQSTTSDERAGTPLLSRIPYLGAAFRQSREREIKTELVILLRPVVIDPDGWETEVTRAATRFDELGIPAVDSADWAPSKLK